MCDRIIVLIDMDCFYCQVEELLDPALKGKPIAVVQYNAWKGGGIIAVNYPARARGVTRHMRGEEAQQICPDIVLARVPNKHNKADTSKYRDAGKRVAAVLQTFTPLLERASVDEAYMDITDNVNKWILSKTGRITKELLHDTFAVGHSDITQFLENVYPEDDSLTDDNILKLAVGAGIANSIREAVFKETGYECSAGIAHNKILAKLICGMNKPNKQTILPHTNLQILYKTLPVTKLRSLGGKFGEHVCESLKIKFMSELLPFSEKQLQHKFSDKYGSWLYNIARGFDNEPVVQRLTSKSIGCCKKFPGRTAIKSITNLKHWLRELSEEIVDRLQKDEIENSRKAKQLIINFTLEINKQDISNSRSSRLISIEVDQIAEQGFDIICQNYPTFIDKDSADLITLPVKFLGLNVGKFENNSNKVKAISSFFSKVDHSIIIDNKIDKNKCNLMVEKNEYEAEVPPGSTDNCNLNLEHWNTLEKKYSNKSLKTQSNDNTSFTSNILTMNDLPSTSKNFVKAVYNDHCDPASNDIYNKSNVLNENNICNSVDVSASSFFLKQYQGEIQDTNENNTNNENKLSAENEENLGTKVNCKIPLNISISNSVHSDDSYSSTTELESILKTENHVLQTETEIQNLIEMHPEHYNHSDNEESTDCTDLDYQLALELSKNDKENQPILQKCNECGKDVPDIITHLDHHLALKISLQQREEFRLNQKLKYSATTPKKDQIQNSARKRKQQKIITKDNVKKSKTIISFFKSQ